MIEIDRYDYVCVGCKHDSSYTSLSVDSGGTGVGWFDLGTISAPIMVRCSNPECSHREIYYYLDLDGKIVSMQPSKSIQFYNSGRFRGDLNHGIPSYD